MRWSIRPPIDCCLRYQGKQERLFGKRNSSHFQKDSVSPWGRITSVYFPLTCVISMMTEMNNGTAIEIAASKGMKVCLGFRFFGNRWR